MFSFSFVLLKILAFAEFHNSKTTPSGSGRKVSEWKRGEKRQTKRNL
jgi:hypothetical protein